MKEDERTKEQLLEELVSQRRHISLLEASIASGRQVEESRRASEEMYRALFDQAAEGIFVTSGDGQVVGVNEAALHMFGFTKEEAIGSDVGQRFADPADRQRFRERIGKGSVREFEVKLHRKDGTDIDVLLSATRLLDNDGNSIGVQGIIQPITERAQGEDPQGVQPERVPQNVSQSVEESEHLPGQSGSVRETGSEVVAPSSKPTQVGTEMADDQSIRDVLIGDVEFVIHPPVQPAALLKLHHWLQESADADVGKFSGTLGSDTLLNITINKPLPLTRIIGSPFIMHIEEETYTVRNKLSEVAKSLGGTAEIVATRRFRLTLVA